MVARTAGGTARLSPHDAQTAHDLINDARPQASGSSKNAGAMPGLTQTQAAVAHVVVEAGGHGDGWCFLGVAKMALRVKVSISTVRQALADLTAKGWLEAKAGRLPREPIIVTHYRLTPVLTDIMPSEEIDAFVAQIRDATAARVAAIRSKLAPPVLPAGGVTVTPAAGVRTPVAGAEEDPEARRDMQPHSRRRLMALPTLTTEPQAPTSTMLGGIRLKLPSHAETHHQALGFNLHGILEHLLPHLADHETAYALAILSAEYNLTPEQITDALRYALADRGDAATPADLQRHILKGYNLTARRSKAAARIMREHGRLSTQSVVG